ncbi:MAG: CBS domain-containing protein [Euryarchaeota archaeon]|nr:CBS domain-containing protein [Euryarchaeota archaeon]
MALLSLSEIVKKPVIDIHGEKVGKLVDVIVSADTPYPKVKALTVRTFDKNTLNVPWTQVEGLGRQIPLKVGRDEIRPYDVQEHEVHLVGDILDKQIIDVQGKKLRRVNDLQLSPTNGAYRLIGVDIGVRGLLRRLGLEKIADRSRIRVEGTYINWDAVDTIHSGPSALQLKLPKHKIDKFHPADIADILDQLSVNDGLNLINALDEEAAADTLEETSPERQVSLIEGMDAERAADILEEMSPDDAADLLGDLPADRAEVILELMEPDESEDVRELLEYPEDTAGGIMTNEFIAVHAGLTAQQAIEEIRTTAADVETIYYIYIIEKDETLAGVISIRDLLLARPEEKLAAFMHTDLITVHVRDDQRDVAKKIAKYNLLALPVVDDEKRLKGIVTVDDAIDIVLPTAWKKRVPKMFG